MSLAEATNYMDLNKIENCKIYTEVKHVCEHMTRLNKLVSECVRFNVPLKT